MLKRTRKCGISSGEVGRIQCFLHMALQIAVVHLLPSEKDSTIKFYQVILMIMVGMSY